MLLSAEVCPPQSADVDSFWHKGAPQSRPDLIEFHCDPSLLPVFVLTACVCLAVFCPSHVIHIHHVFPEEGCVRSALFSISVFSLLKGLRHWAHITLLSFFFNSSIMAHSNVHSSSKRPYKYFRNTKHTSAGAMHPKNLVEQKKKQT